MPVAVAISKSLRLRTRAREQMFDPCFEDNIMKRSIGRIICGIAYAIFTCMPSFGAAPTQQSAKFDVNDVSFLCPAPSSVADVDKLISVDETNSAGEAFWPEDSFQTVMTAAGALKVVDTRPSEFRIQLNPQGADLKSRRIWKIAGIRVDPSAPGCDPKIQAQSPVGVKPQIRLIVQPVTVRGTAVRIHDVAAHLVFDFEAARTPTQKSLAFEPVIADLRVLKERLLSKGIDTQGELRVHPGFGDPDFVGELRNFLKTHLQAVRLNSIAFMGIHSSEPWIFFAMAKPKGELVRVGHPSLGASLDQLLSFGPASDPVIPFPDNRTFVDKSAGLSTALMFGPAVNLDAPAMPDAVDAELQGVKIRDIPNIIANPQVSHFFNTDCVSCHTESTRRANFKLDAGAGPFHYLRPAGISGPALNLLPASPRQSWSTRNFGWFPLATPKETVTVRTANEAAESAEFINRVYLNQSSDRDAGPDKVVDPQPVVAEVQVPQALTLVMTIKSPEDARQLRELLTKIQGEREKSPITTGMDRLGIVHDARFVFLEEDKLMVITTYDGDFDLYIGLFTKELGPVFNMLLKHMKDAPADVEKDPAAFLEYVKKNDRKSFGGFYSGYPTLSVQDIRGLHRKAQESNGIRR